MLVDPQLQSLVEAIKTTGLLEIGSISIPEMRKRSKAPLVIKDQIAIVNDTKLPGPATMLPIRIYRPSDVTEGLIVYFHGGGWVFGDLDSVDATIRAIVSATNCTAISVDYRLAPEHPFPAAVDDAFAAVEWVARHARDLTGQDTAPLILMGDSAGGNLAAVCAQHAKNAGGPAIALQVLIYPSTEGDGITKGVSAFEPPLLKQSELAWCMDQYIPMASRQDIRFAPGKAARLAGLPPTIIVTAEHDLLTAEGLAYGDKLRKENCEVTSLHYLGAIHGFVTIGASFDIGRRAIRDISNEIINRLRETTLSYEHV